MRHQRIIVGIFATLLMFFSSCTKESIPEIIKITFDHPQSANKVYIDDAGQPYWHYNDDICIGDQKQKITYNQDGTAYINTKDIGKPQYGSEYHYDYPYIAVLGTGAWGRVGTGNDAGKLKGGAQVKPVHKFEVCETYSGSGVYTEKVWAPMMGCLWDGASNIIHMKNLAGILRFKLKTSDITIIDAIQIESDSISNSNKPIAGYINCAWDIDNDQPGTYTITGPKYSANVHTIGRITTGSGYTTICHIPVIPVQDATLKITVTGHTYRGTVTYTRTQTNHTFSINRNELITLQADLDDGNWTRTVVEHPNMRVANYYFTIDAIGSAVEFATGNLQYCPSTKTYQTAAHQYDVLSQANDNISADYTGWIDLFGYHAGSNAADATNNVISTINNDDYLGAFVEYQPANTGWRTPKISELEYILTQRGQTYMCAIAKIRTDQTPIDGLIIFPDGFTPPSGISINDPNSLQNAVATQNTYTSGQWDDLDRLGCVFLPNCGYRSGTTTNRNDGARYWTSDLGGNYTSGTSLEIYNNKWNYANSNKYIGRGVRLIKYCIPSTSSTKKK